MGKIWEQQPRRFAFIFPVRCRNVCGTFVEHLLLFCFDVTTREKMWRISSRPCKPFGLSPWRAVLVGNRLSGMFFSAFGPLNKGFMGTLAWTRLHLLRSRHLALFFHCGEWYLFTGCRGPQALLGPVVLLGPPLIHPLHLRATPSCGDVPEYDVRGGGVDEAVVAKVQRLGRGKPGDLYSTSCEEVRYHSPHYPPCRQRRGPWTPGCRRRPSWRTCPSSAAWRSHRSRAAARGTAPPRSSRNLAKKGKNNKNQIICKGEKKKNKLRGS